jgi:lysophospholipid acyltransferase
MMVLTMKLTTFAWNLYDGQRSTSELDKVQVVSRVPALPRLLDFTGFALFFPGILVGPSFTYASYDTFLNRSLFDKAIKANGRRLPSGRFRKMFQRLLTGVIMMGVFSLYGGKYGYERILEPDFESKGFLYACVFAPPSASFLTFDEKAHSQIGLYPTRWLSHEDEILRRLVYLGSGLYRLWRRL